jgi:hypothetical protein
MAESAKAGVGGPVEFVAPSLTKEGDEWVAWLTTPDNMIRATGQTPAAAFVTALAQKQAENIKAGLS